MNAALREESTERRKAQQGELLAAQKLRIHFERTPLAVLEWDVKGRITDWNPAAEAIFGHPAADAVGKPLALLLAAEDERKNADAMCRELLESGDGNKATLTNMT